MTEPEKPDFSGIVSEGDVVIPGPWWEGTVLTCPNGHGFKLDFTTYLGVKPCTCLGPKSAHVHCPVCAADTHFVLPAGARIVSPELEKARSWFLRNEGVSCETCGVEIPATQELAERMWECGCDRSTHYVPCPNCHADQHFNLDDLKRMHRATVSFMLTGGGYPLELSNRNFFFEGREGPFKSAFSVILREAEKGSWNLSSAHLTVREPETWDFDLKCYASKTTVFATRAFADGSWPIEYLRKAARDPEHYGRIVWFEDDYGPLDRGAD